MKYTREQVKAMTQEEYESAICKEPQIRNRPHKMTQRSKR